MLTEKRHSISHGPPFSPKPINVIPWKHLWLRVHLHSPAPNESLQVQVPFLPLPMIKVSLISKAGSDSYSGISRQTGETWLNLRMAQNNLRATMQFH